MGKKKILIWDFSSETETPVRLQWLLSPFSSFKQRSTKAQKWKRRSTGRGLSDEVSASPGSTGNFIMKVVLVKIPAWIKQTPEALIIRIIHHSPGQAPGWFCRREFCSQSVSAGSWSSHCTGFKINPSQTLMKIGSKGDERKHQINQAPPVFSTSPSSIPYHPTSPSPFQPIPGTAPWAQSLRCIFSPLLEHPSLSFPVFPGDLG